MKLSEFDYKLPKKLIAIEPSVDRSKAKLLVLNRQTGSLEDDYFFNLGLRLRSGDILVLNDTKVIPARLIGRCKDREFEVLLVKQIDESSWECWVKPGKRAIVNSIFTFGPRLKGKLLKRKNEIFVFEFNLNGKELFSEIKKTGQVPIPPYILKARKDLHKAEYSSKDIYNYQTIFAQKNGSVAAPTAGLHFDRSLLEQLSKNGIQIEKVTLHVSLGTFQPVNTDEIEDFRIHSEYFDLNEDTAKRLNQAKNEGRRIIAVGTTSVRVLESAAKVDSNELVAKAGETSIYVYPGYKFKFIDGMITNFHLPKSSLLLLVSAFAGKSEIRQAYDYAIQNNYRFYSYGDGMLIL
ncbi:MAG: tRNA preQ1(34) S-adenosylmethionine ribosyltransferase-isomerase QueA [Patescibacteria group bacterium]|jgi:S-adenosylmethionine:tRNA ribosyltransferase-isomerase|nr:tRNA preQ1(34) S-adenosylmethionine ribosyltransferase-isomerase QueA [Patescibacteria group bacterium]